jgi:hypothetical protein
MPRWCPLGWGEKNEKDEEPGKNEIKKANVCAVSALP